MIFFSSNYVMSWT